MERLFQQAALGAGAIEDGKVAKVPRRRFRTAGAPGVQRKIASAADQLLDLVDNLFGFGFVGGCAVDFQLGLIDKLRPDGKRFGAIRAAIDHLHRSVENGLGRAVVAA